MLTKEVTWLYFRSAAFIQRGRINVFKSRRMVYEKDLSNTSLPLSSQLQPLMSYLSLYILIVNMRCRGRNVHGIGNATE